MPIELKIIASNAFELAGELRQLGYVHKDEIEEMAADAAQEKVPEPLRVHATSEEADAAEQSYQMDVMDARNEAKAAVKKRRGRPPKVKVEEPPREVVPQEADDTPVPFAEEQPPPTATDMAKAALVQLNSVGGRDAALEVLGRFGAKKFSEVPVERHDEFREICIIETQKRAS